MVVVALVPGAPRAAERLSLIRDAEIENIIQTWGAPLFQAAGVEPKAVKVHLVKDPGLNAFVAGGLNLFLNTGLIIRTEHAGQVIGVIAHEAGHIAGGHLARMDEAVAGATAESILTMVLGAAAAAASGRGDVAGAVMMGGIHVGQRSFMAYTRGQESAADQAAMRMLESTHQSTRGLLEFMDILGDQEILLTQRQDPYVRTHPLTRERVSALQDFVGRSKYADAPLPKAYGEMHLRMRAKLFAFLEQPSRTLQRYPESDASLAARYARAIAWYRKPDLMRAVPAIDQLIAERPTDPYFHELKGQMLFENGKPREALAPYREAVRLAPDSALLRIGLAQVQVELGERPLLNEAKSQLRDALHSEITNAFAWKLLAIAYGRTDETALASYALAEYSLLVGRPADALFHARQAEAALPAGSPNWLRVQDIESAAERMKEEMRERRG